MAQETKGATGKTATNKLIDKLHYHNVKLRQLKQKRHILNDTNEQVD